MNIINVKQVTDFWWFCGLDDFISKRVRYPVNSLL